MVGSSMLWWAAIACLQYTVAFISQYRTFTTNVRPTIAITAKFGSESGLSEKHHFETVLGMVTNKVVVGALAGLLCFPLSSLVSIADDGSRPGVQVYHSVRPYAYSVEMVDPPGLLPRKHPAGETSLLQRLSKSHAVLFGEHSGISPIGRDKIKSSLLADRKLEVDLIDRMQREGQLKRAVVYIQQLPRTAAVNVVLQDYLTRTTAEWETFVAKLVEVTDLSNEEISALQPLLKYCKEYSSTLEVAPIGLPRQFFDKVLEKGLQALTEDEKRQLIKNVNVFVDVSSQPGFPAYTESLLSENFATSIARGKIPANTNQINYVSAKLLEHHFVASVLSEAAGQRVSQPSAPLVIALLDGQDVAFGFGVEERLKRLVEADLTPPSTSEEQSESVSETKQKPSLIYSVFLNPTAADTHTLLTQLNLVLRYGVQLPYQRPFADFLWFSEYPASNLLTRMKNPISREGDKPPGESSVLGAF